MNVPNELVYNYLVDLKKKDINPLIRADIIKRYLQELGHTQRYLAKSLGMPHSTL